MSRRHTPPDHRDPDAFAGLTQRRRERGLPVGTGEDQPERREPSIQCGGGYHFLCRDRNCGCWCHS